MLRWLAALIVFAVAVPAAHADDWKKWSSKECKCEMLFPDDPKQQEQPIDGSSTTMTTFVWEEPTNHDIAYLVGYIDLPVKQSSKVRLDNAVGGLVAKMGKPKSQKDVTFKGMAGREIVIENSGMELTYRLLIANDRLYTLGGARGATAKGPYDPKKFLDSLVVTK